MKISNTKSQLVCVVCRREIAVWVTEKEEKVYPENARFYTESTLEDLV